MLLSQKSAFEVKFGKSFCDIDNTTDFFLIRIERE